MPDEITHDDDTDETPAIRQLREVNRRLEDEAREGREARRRLAFMDAGVDLSSRATQRIVETYDGDLTPEAVKAFAEDLELVTPPADPADKVDPGGQQTQMRRSLTAEGEVAPVVPEPTRDVVEGMFEDYHEARKSGTSRDEASAAIFGAILGGAAAGDEQFLFDPLAHKQAAREAAE